MNNFRGKKIQKHKGTQFKTKKAFNQSKKALVESQKTSDITLESREIDNTPFWSKHLKLVIALVAVILLLTISYLIYSKFNSISI